MSDGYFEYFLRYCDQWGGEGTALAYANSLDEAIEQTHKMEAFVNGVAVIRNNIEVISIKRRRKPVPYIRKKQPYQPIANGSYHGFTI